MGNTIPKLPMIPNFQLPQIPQFQIPKMPQIPQSPQVIQSDKAINTRNTTNPNSITTNYPTTTLRTTANTNRICVDNGSNWNAGYGSCYSYAPNFETLTIIIAQLMLIIMVYQRLKHVVNVEVVIIMVSEKFQQINLHKTSLLQQYQQLLNKYQLQ